MCHAIALLAVALLRGPLPAAETAKPKEPESLVGTWRYVHEVDRSEDGETIDLAPPAGYGGLLVYTADGHVSAQIWTKDRKWASPPTAAELRETIEAGTGYFGRYEVDQKARKVRHIVEGSVDPVFDGAVLTRSYDLSKDTLVLSGEFEHDGDTLTFFVTWERVKGP
jgi:hypothetical protein